MRGRNNNNNNNNNRRSHNPLTRVYESNGPDVKIRGTANHVAEKYLQLARDAQSSGDPVSAENYFQHAEHYFRLIAAAQEQFRQHNPNFQPRPEGGGNDQQFQPRQRRAISRTATTTRQPFAASSRSARASRSPTFRRMRSPSCRATTSPISRASRTTRSRRKSRHQPRLPQPEPGNDDRLPAFITGGAPQPQPPQAQNGYENGGGQPDRFPLHRRRRRHRGPRGDMPRPAGRRRPAGRLPARS